MIRIIEPEELAMRWHEIAPQVELALSHGTQESSIHDIFMECMNMNAQCWELEHGVGITRFIHFNQYKQLQIMTLTGENIIEHLEEYHKTIEEFAKGTGCRNVSVYGRKGWGKVLPKGYTTTYHVYTKEI